jgi:hypothetical protein
VLIIASVPTNNTFTTGDFKMAEYTGSALYMTWIHPAGTAVLSTDYRTVSTAPTIGLVQSTAGSDAANTYLTTVKDGVISWAGVDQTAGTVLYVALKEGTSGTLIIAPEGTASGKPKETIPAISQGAQRNIPYDNVVELSCSFQQNGVRVDGNY